MRFLPVRYLNEAMKNLFYITVALLAPLSLHAADPSMTQKERDKVIQLLKDSQQEFVKAVTDLTDEQWRWKPSPERWSVGEVAEHVMLAETALFSKMQEAIDKPANPDWERKTKGKTELLLQMSAPRLGKAKSTEAIVLAGTLRDAESITWT